MEVSQMSHLKAMPGATRHFAPPAPGPKQGYKTSNLKLRPAELLYMVGEKLDWSWYQHQIDAVIEDYNNGVPFVEMATRLNRDYREVVNLIMELAEYGRIKPRASGIF
jgi:hypothetical protein